MDSARTDREYMIMGKIVEKERQLNELRTELENIEYARSNVTITNTLLIQDTINSEDEEIVEDLNFANGVENDQDIIEASINHTAQPPINFDKKFSIIHSDEEHAKAISAGGYLAVRWGTEKTVAAWSKGRKYDPKNVRITKIRTLLRIGPKTVRELSTQTSLAVNTLKELLREMDRQGFFVQ